LNHKEYFGYKTKYIVTKKPDINQILT